VSWSRRFDEPVELPDGRKLKTLAEAMACLAPVHRALAATPPPTSRRAYRKALSPMASKPH